MRALLTSLLPLLLATAAAAAPLAPGDLLPTVRGELLTGRDAELPALTHGRPALVAFGFTRGSSRDVGAWVSRWRAARGVDTTFTWVEVPMLGGAMARMMRPLITSGMRGGTPEADRLHVMPAWGAPPEWRDWLACPGSGARADAACLVLLDRDGRVRWRGTGPLDDSRWQALAAAADSLR